MSERTERTQPTDRTERIRLADVARAAGVAESTASRVFSNPERVSVETVESVRRVAAELGFHPRGIAKSPGLPAKSIDLLVQELSNPFFASLFTGVERQARTAGYTVTLGIAEESAEMERQHVSRVIDAVSGYIVHARWLADADLLELNRKKPVVLFNREIEGLSSVAFDFEDGSRQIIEHLASLGHRRIVYVAGPPLSWSESRRWAGLSDAAAQHGIELDKVGPFVPILSQGAAAAEVAMSRHPTAIIAFNDQIAIGLMRRLQHIGVDVPRQVSVVGYDDTFGSDFVQPALTTVHAPVDQAGRLATDVLLSLINGTAEPNAYRLPGPLVVRDSTASTTAASASRA